MTSERKTFHVRLGLMNTNRMRHNLTKWGWLHAKLQTEFDEWSSLLTQGGCTYVSKIWRLFRIRRLIFSLPEAWIVFCKAFFAHEKCNILHLYENTFRIISEKNAINFICFAVWSNYLLHSRLYKNCMWNGFVNNS